ncbi:olfactory receptor 9G19-like [Lampetra fluviatilis]
MEQNQSLPSDLILMASVFRSPPAVTYAAVATVLVIYVVAVAGNSLLCVAIASDRRLHKPVYVLVAALAITDLVESTNSLPRIAHDAASPRGNVMSVGECYAQMCVLHVSIRVQGYTLVAMGVDRYLAVCRPLRYHALVSNGAALKAVAAAVAASSLMAVGNVVLVARLTLCRDKVIRAPNCDFLVMSGLACGGDGASAVVAYTLLTSSVTIALPLCAVVVTYGLILREVRTRPESRGSQGKALRTSVTHLTIVALYFGSILFTIASGLKLFSWLSVEVRYPLQTLQYVVPPAVNPIVYGLRMKEIGRSLRGVFSHRHRRVDGGI